MASALLLTISMVPGLYHDQNGRSLYAALDVDGPAVVNWIDPVNQHDGGLPELPKTWRLQREVHEKRLTVDAPEGRLGVSLYYADPKRRATVILIHGNDNETRDVGYLIPMFALNGVNVVSYDQRGTGESIGSWRENGPEQRASDVNAIYDALQREPLVDGKRIGLWAFSNGGWTAPIVSLQRSIAFMMLVGAPASSVADNIYYEIRQEGPHRRYDSATTDQAVMTVRTLLNVVAGTGSWENAARQYDVVRNQPWLAALNLSPTMKIPPPQERIDAFRRADIYDPAQTLTRVTVPTLALYGALDRAVDTAHDAPALQSAFKQAGMTDFTLRTYPQAGHSLFVSQTGFPDQKSLPHRRVPGYTQAMIGWLQAREFTTDSATLALPHQAH
ncbi:MAG: alpha/beta hydrolase [Candidatus Eremiobacteraeota bacterium]|nr:alpha/beta hydrolase [Candidatus Eremiobacteraeota bacterium]